MWGKSVIFPWAILARLKKKGRKKKTEIKIWNATQNICISNSMWNAKRYKKKKMVKYHSLSPSSQSFCEKKRIVVVQRVLHLNVFETNHIILVNWKKWMLTKAIHTQLCMLYWIVMWKKNHTNIRLESCIHNHRPE